MEKCGKIVENCVADLSKQMFVILVVNPAFATFLAFCETQTVQLRQLFAV